MPSSIAKTIMYGVQTMLGDAFVCWRTYIVWGRKRSGWPVFGPGILLLATCGKYRCFYRTGENHTKKKTHATAVSGISFLVQYARYGLSLRYRSLLKGWTIAWLALTFTTNFICTCAIAYRIVLLQRGSLSDIPNKLTKNAHQSSPSLHGILVVLVESAALYTSAILSAMICIILNKVGTWTISSMVCSHVHP